jgi:hypothetical protein
LNGDEGVWNLAEVHSNDNASGIADVAKAAPSEQTAGSPLIDLSGAKLGLHIVIGDLSTDAFRIVHFHAAAWKGKP